MERVIFGYLGREIKREDSLKEYIEINSKIGGIPLKISQELITIHKTLYRNTPYSTAKKRVLYLFYCENIYCKTTWTVFRSSIESNLVICTANKDNCVISDDWLLSAGIDTKALQNKCNITNDSITTEHVLANNKKVEKSYLIKYISEECIGDDDHKTKFLLDSYLSNTEDDPIEIKKGKDSDISSDESSMDHIDQSNIDESFYVRDKDRYLHNFSLEVSRFPKQIIRYSFGGTPLYSEPPKSISIPGCKKCGSDKVFEFQILSTIIYEWGKAFGEDDAFVKCNTDWSTIIVYTCSKDCNVEFFEESLLIQHFK
ncbi:hypothetical protein OJ253_1182 [Cryptosporidium canis]|uniref:C2H2-type domain-containing protein n=1 Tax=Cryptosporidium canis TaxID=195482 RepID=A0A9D5DKI3_9CRYT|nr:hypothetical protein OJ253_1182 [Cryptosporidium canis]